MNGELYLEEKKKHICNLAQCTVQEVATLTVTFIQNQSVTGLDPASVTGMCRV